MLPCEPLARTLHSCHNLMNGCTSSHQEWAVLTGFHVLVDVSCTVYPFLSSRCFPTSFWQGLLNVFVFSHNTWNFARVLASCHMSWRARSAHPLRPFNDIFKDYQASLRAAVRTLIPASRPQMIQRWPMPHFRDSFHQFANSTFQLDATPFHLLHQSCPLRFHSPHLLLNQSPPFAFQHALLEHY